MLPSYFVRQGVSFPIIFNMLCYEAVSKIMS